MRLNRQKKAQYFQKIADKLRVKDVCGIISKLLLIFVSIFILAPSVFSASHTTYQAKIIKPDGYPLEFNNVNFKFTILEPAGNCILYAETYSSVNMANTGGLISFSLGSGVKTYPVSSPTFFDIFNNAVASHSCDTGGPASYSPGANDTRKIVMQFHDGNGWQTLPAMTINAVPYAMYANDSQKLGGVSATSYVRYSTIPTCTASQVLQYTGASFNCVALPSAGAFSAADVATALSYTPADAVSVTSLNSEIGNVSSTVYAVSSTVNSLTSNFSSLQNSVAVSLAAITSSQWVTSGTAIFYNSGNVVVSGGLRISMEAAACSANLAGTLRYNSGAVEFCNGTMWSAFGVSGAGLQGLNGSTSGTQSFAIGTAGTAPTFVTNNGVHTLNIPSASTGSVTGGLLSNADYSTFMNKITSSAASIAQVLGYTPASSTALANYLLRASNLSDLTSSATARANLGVGYIGTLLNVDLSSSDVSGTLAIARTPSYIGDVTKAAASNTLVLSTTGVTAGTYNKVTVDAKGRVTSSSALSASDVNTALGYTAANSATVSSLNTAVTTSFTSLSNSVTSVSNTLATLSGTVGSKVSSQWTTSGSTIYYNNGYVGIGTATPSSGLHVHMASGLRITDGSTDTANTITASGPNVTYSSNGSQQIVLDSNNNNNSGDDFGIYAASTATTPFFFIERTGGYVGIGTVAPSAALHLKAGTSQTSSLKLTSGVLLTAPQSGTVEYDGSYYYITDGANTRRVIATVANPGTYDGASTITSTGNISLVPVGSVIVSATTASTNSQTGALVVNGGLGVAGNIYSSGTIITSSNIQGTSITATNGMITPYIAGSIASSGNLTLDSTTHNTKGKIILAPNGGNVGIGTTAPSTALTVLAPVAGGGIDITAIDGVADDNFGISWKIPALGHELARINAEYPTSASSGTGILKFKVRDAGNLADRMTILGNGNVGIGTTSPQGQLHIGKQEATPGVSGTANRLVIQPYGHTGGPWKVDARDLGADAFLDFKYGANNLMTFEDSGNVGIGTTSPGSALSIKSSTANNTTGDGFTNLRLEYAGGYNAGDIGAGVTFAQQYVDPGTDAAAIRVGGIFGVKTQATGNFGGGLAFFRQPAGAANMSEAMRIDQNGNVGIGLANPSANLHVSGPANSNTFKVTAGTNELLIGEDADLPGMIRMRSTAGSGVVITGNNDTPGVFVQASTSNVGIGTTTPITRLDVLGTIGFYGGTLNGDTYERAVFYADNTNGLLLEAPVVSSTRQDISFSHRGYGLAGAQLVIKGATGNVGIGTTNPNASLDVSGSMIVTDGIFGANTGAPDATIFGVSKATYPNWGLFYNEGAPDYIEYKSAGVVTSRIELDSGSAHFALNGGNVGVGTTAPTAGYRMDVFGDMYVGNGGASQTIRFRTANTDGGFIRFNSTADSAGNSSLEIGTTDNLDEPITFTQSGNERMRIHTNSYVGIGTATPTTHLAVNANAATGYTIISNKNSAAGGQEWRWYSSSTGAPLGADSMCFGTGVCYFSLYTTGNATLAGTLTQSSDVRFKRDISSIPDALDAVTKLEGVTYYWKDSTKDAAKQLGLIAQDVEKVFPEAVKTNAQGFKSVAYQNLIAPLINALREVREWMFKTDERVLALEKDNAKIKAENLMLKEYLCEKDPNASICK